MTRVGLGCHETRSVLDKSLGLDCYITPEDLYVEARGRLSRDNFSVYELARDLGLAGPDYSPQPHVHREGEKLCVYILRKRSIDTLSAIEKVKRLLRPADIYFLGLKDKSAETYQFIGIERPRLFTGYVSRGLVELFFIGMYPRERFNREALLGNCFRVRLTSLVDNAPDRLDKIMGLVAETGFIPNYYSYQRFGTRRVITHLVGKYILEDRPDDVVRVLVCHPLERCDVCEKCRDIVSSGKRWMWVEKKICERVCLEKVQNLVEMFRGLPRRLMVLYVSALFSYVFNLYLSMRWRSCGLGTEPCPGEKTEKSLISSLYIPYLEIELREKGLETHSGDRDMVLETIERVLEERDPGTLSRRIERLTGLKRFVLKRSLVAPLERLVYRDSELSFCLERGGYATILLREIFKESIYRML